MVDLLERFDRSGDHNRDFLSNHPEWHEDFAVAASLSVVFGPCVILSNRIVGGPEAYQAMGVFGAIACVFAVAISTIAVRSAIRDPKEQTSVVRQQDRLLARIKAASGV